MTDTTETIKAKCCHSELCGWQWLGPSAGLRDGIFKIKAAALFAGKTNLATQHMGTKVKLGGFN